MAVAVQSSAESKTPPLPLGLLAASAVGAVFVLVAAGLVLRGLPALWDSGVHATLSRFSNSFISTALLLLGQVAAVVGLIYVGGKIARGQHVTGLRGGIFLMIAVAFTVLFCGRAIVRAADSGFNFGNIIVILFFAVILGLVVQFFRTGRFTAWSVLVDQMGWFSTANYKRSQGLKVRRLTMLGILLIAGTGIWTLIHHDYLPHNQTVRVDGEERDNRFGDWVIGGEVLNPIPLPTAKATATDDEKAKIEADRNEIRVKNQGRPRIEGGFTILSNLVFAVPLLLIGASLWVAWRTVNYPTFADFLIATEAEINKVSWTSRKALIRDTIVVLVSLVLLTLFLFIVDIFWNFLLSRPIVGVLPTANEQKEAAEKTKRATAEDVKDW